MLRNHAFPSAGIPILEGEALTVGPVAQDHRHRLIPDGTVEVASQHQTVIHRNLDVPIDLHPVANFGPVHLCSPQAYCTASIFDQAALIPWRL